MSIKPILFSGSMVRAILEGRKTQTRRVIDIPFLDGTNPEFSQMEAYQEADGVWRIYGSEPASKQFKTKHHVADLIYVRERWAVWNNYDELKPSDIPANSAVFFDADSVWEYEETSPPECFGKDRPSIFLPRWASRITLKVTDVRVQRLQDTSEEDAQAEGVERRGSLAFGPEFIDLWDSINATRKGGIYAWDKNPWVVAYTFKPIFQNVDQIGECS